jgi:hypothetical protein
VSDADTVFIMNELVRIAQLNGCICFDGDGSGAGFCPHCDGEATCLPIPASIPDDANEEGQ